MDVWKYETAHRSPHIAASGKYVNYLLGARFPGINNAIMNNISLYQFLLKHRDMPVHELRKRILMEDKPIFSESELRCILETVRSQKNSSFARWLTNNSVGGADHPEHDPSRNKFWDKFMRKYLGDTGKQFPPSWNGVFWYISVLYYLEQMDFVGPVISTALDTITLSLPVLADLASEVTSKMLMLAPLPYAGLAGEALGYVIGLFFVGVAVMLNVSRNHFGSAFKAGLEGMPVFGDVLAEGAQSFEIGAERYLQNRQRLLRSLDKVSPSAEGFLDYYTPDLDPKKGPAPVWDEAKVKSNIMSYVAKETGADKALAVLEDPSAALGQAVADKQAQVGSIVSGAVAEKQPQVSSAVANAKTKPLNSVAKAVVGGSRKRKARKTKTRKHRK
jgi:hypothetical protein